VGRHDAGRRLVDIVWDIVLLKSNYRFLIGIVITQSIKEDSSQAIATMGLLQPAGHLKAQTSDTTGQPL
jgi:hypothetical protein